MLEGVDADRALAELARVVRPGGLIAVAVVATDIPFWSSLPLRPELRAKLATISRFAAAARGCADASLYRRFRALGLTEVTMGPRFAVDDPVAHGRDRRAMIEATMQAALDPAEVPEWRAAVAQAEADGSYLWSLAYHCAVGTKP